METLALCPNCGSSNIVAMGVTYTNWKIDGWDKNKRPILGECEYGDFELNKGDVIQLYEYCFDCFFEPEFETIE